MTAFAELDAQNPHAFPAPSREHDLRYAADCAMAGGHTTVGADGNYTDCVKP